MHLTRLGSSIILGAAGLGIAIGAGQAMNMTSLMAQEARQLERESTMIQRGKVTSRLKNDHGDVDGLQLENGVRVHFPPHMADRIMAVVEIGDTVEVDGRQEVTPDGAKVFEITRLTSGKQTVQIEHPRHGPGPEGPRDEQPMNAAGKVIEYARNPHGDVDGLTLKDGTVVKFPPHQARELLDLVAIGDKVTIEGRRHVTPRGEIHLHADQIEANGQAITREGPKHGPKGPKHGPGAFDDNGPTNADLLRELKAIRQLLEKQARS